MQDNPVTGHSPEEHSVHLSVVIPVYNNERTLNELVDRLVRVMHDCCTRHHEIILVDDGSADRSWVVIGELSGHFPEVVGLRLSRNFGQHAAITAGVEAALGELTGIMDADLEHRPEDLPVLLAKIEEGADLAVAVDEARVRRLSSILFQMLFGHISQGATHPKALTYRVMNSSFRDALKQYGEVDVVLGPLMSTMGFAQQYVPVQRSVPRGRHTSYSLTRRTSLALKALLAHAMLIPTVLGAVSAVIALGLVVFAVIVVVQALLLDTQLPSGLTLVLITLLLSSAAILGSLAFLSYVAIAILREVKARPRFHVSQTLGEPTLTKPPRR